MFKELKKSPIVQRIEEHGCTDLAAKLTKRQGIGFQVGLRATLNGRRSQNPYRQTVARLVAGNLQGRGFEYVRRSVDHTCTVCRANIRPAERDKLAYLLDAGLLRTKK